MDIIMDISGRVSLTLVDKDAKELPEKEAAAIYKKLKAGDLFLGFMSKRVFDPSDLDNDICYTEVELGDMEYTYSEEED